MEPVLTGAAVAHCYKLLPTFYLLIYIGWLIWKLYLDFRGLGFYKEDNQRICERESLYKVSNHYTIQISLEQCLNGVTQKQ